MNNSKGFSKIIIALGAAVIIGMGLYFYMIKSDTSKTATQPMPDAISSSTEVNVMEKEVADLETELKDEDFSDLDADINSL